MFSVAVVILNWNGKNLLQEFLPSVINSLPDYAELIIADNASSDDSVAFIKQHYPQLQVIKNEFNGGFAKGYNDALKNLEHEYLVLLNSDIETPQGWIEPVIEFMQANPQAGAAMPKIKQQVKKTHFEYAGAAGGYIDYLGYPFCRGRIFEELEKDEQQYNGIATVFWATGACMFVRNKIYKKLGGFDEFFFAHMEEIDLCWRIQRLGFSIHAIGKSEVYHVGGGTLNKTSPRKTFLNFRNNLLLLVKNETRRRLSFIILAKLILDGVAGAKFLSEGKAQHTLAIVKAHYSFFRAFPKYYKLRKQLKKELPNQQIQGVFQNLIVWKYFLKNNKKFSALKSTDFS